MQIKIPGNILQLNTDDTIKKSGIAHNIISVIMSSKFKISIFYLFLSAIA